MGLCVQRRIVSKAEKRWNCAVALLLCKHARLRQAACVAHAQIIGIQRSGNQRIQIWAKPNSSAPALSAGSNLIVCSVVMIDVALQQKLGLLLRALVVKAFDFVL